MAAKATSASGRKRVPHKVVVTFAALLLSVARFAQGSEPEISPVISSQRGWEKNAPESVDFPGFKSVKETRTGYESLEGSTEAYLAIETTEMDGGDCCGETRREWRSAAERTISNGSDEREPESDGSVRIRARGGSSDEYYDAIRPTRAATSEEHRIRRTGEEEGVSVSPLPRPRSGPPGEKSSEGAEPGTEAKAAGSKFGGEASARHSDRRRLGKNRNRIEESLEKAAKTETRDRLEGASAFRKSREEENRKASPDIQDIITGIVKILNGKGGGGQATEEAPGRPNRPPATGTRINNRGPPRISDLPPLEFEGAPAFVPPPPPPYPFALPPAAPNIPLPPQPLRPGQSALPAHPFIDGVPIPELVVPGKRPPSPGGTPDPEYDTIGASVSQPEGAHEFPSLTTDGDRGPGTGATEPANGRPVDSRPEDGSFSDGGTEQEKIGPGPGYRPTSLLVGSSSAEAAPARDASASEPTVAPTTGESGTGGEKPQPTTHGKDSEGVFLTTAATATTTSWETTRASDARPSLGVGEAAPVLESSLPETAASETEQGATSTPALSASRAPATAAEASAGFQVRPGIVLDDPEFKPVAHKHPGSSARPVITAPPPHGHFGEIFDVTVHAVQGPGPEDSSVAVKPFVYRGEANSEDAAARDPKLPGGDVSVITRPEEGQDFVSIDGKRTYINLFGESTSGPKPAATQPPAVLGTGYAGGQGEVAVRRRPVVPTPSRRPYKRPSHPPVRIDTCIVGDDTTCDTAQNEMCRTEEGVSSCHCRPGYNRRKHRDACRRVVSMLTSLRVDRLYDRKVTWRDSLTDPDSDEYRQLSFEASQAIESAMSMTPFSDDFINSRINSIYSGENPETSEPAVYVNVTIQLEENLDTVRPAVKHDIQRHLLRVIQRRNNNVGNSAVWVDGPPGSVLALQDVDECSSAELHDCHRRAICSNTFGSFECRCPEGSRDPWSGNVHRQGRHCEICSSEYCSNRGECRFEQGRQICRCSGSFYGAQCEVDGEVLGVAVGASVAAAIIIVLTLVCLCMWSRKWSREQKSAVGPGLGSPVFGYMATGPAVKTPNVGGPPYQVTIEDRIRWAQIADAMAQANHYAPEPGTGGTRTSLAGYPPLPGLALGAKGTLPRTAPTPPVPLPRLSLPKKAASGGGGGGGGGGYGVFGQQGSLQQRTAALRTSVDATSSSEEEDRADLLGRQFNAPRPKSRTSVANQSGIYYDVDYGRSDVYSKQNTIPMNTYTLNPQHQARSFFR